MGLDKNDWDDLRGVLPVATLTLPLDIANHLENRFLEPIPTV